MSSFAQSMSPIIMLFASVKRLSKALRFYESMFISTIAHICTSFQSRVLIRYLYSNVTLVSFVSHVTCVACGYPCYPCFLCYFSYPCYFHCFSSSISYFQWSNSVNKGFKMLWLLIKWLQVGSTNYVNTLCGQTISILVLRHFYWGVETVNFKALLTYHFLNTNYSYFIVHEST